MNIVQLGGININTIVTSKEEILKVCRDIVSQKGLSALNMRSLAEACHVALGSLYNYFPSKDDLIITTIESVWQDIFHMEHKCDTTMSFPEYVAWVFESVRHGAKEYPNFLTAHSLSFASAGKNRAKETMEHYFSHMKAGMIEVLNADVSIRKDAFSDKFTKLDFVDFILDNILMLLMHQAESCDILLDIIHRTIYSD